MTILVCAVLITYPLVIDISQNSSHQLNQEDHQQAKEILWIRKRTESQYEQYSEVTQLEKFPRLVTVQQKLPSAVIVLHLSRLTQMAMPREDRTENLFDRL